MQFKPLTSPEEVDAFLRANTQAIIFKAGTCHKTMEGFQQLQTALGERALPIGFIKVVENRAASDRVTELTGIVHHSPQVMMFDAGESFFNLDNWSITVDALTPALAHYR